MKTKYFTHIILCAGLAGAGLLLLLAFLFSQVAEAQSSAPDQPSVVTQGPDIPLKVFPNPPQAHEPTELRLDLLNDTDAELTRYAQFLWCESGIGMELHPIEGRIPFILPPHATGSASVMWIPPDSGPYCFFAELYDAPGAPDPIDRFLHQVIFRGYPDPALPYTQTIPIPVHNPFPVQATIMMTLNVPMSATLWQASLEPTQVVLSPGQTILAQAVFTYAGGGQLPPGGQEVFFLNSTANGQPFTGADMVFGPPLQLHMRPEPFFAESEISVNPYPIPPGEPAEICAIVRNLTHQPREALVFFRAAPLGIGLTFEPVAPPVHVVIPELGVQRPCIHWVPPQGGQFGFEVQLETFGYPMMLASQRVMDVGELLLPGTTSQLHFPVQNPLGEPVTVTLGLHPFPLNWGLTLFPDVLANMGPHETRMVTLTVTIPPGSPMPLDEGPVVDVEAFVGPMPIGGFRKIYRPPVPIHIPGEPIYAESEITVEPYPPQEREPTQICVKVRNPTPVDQVMTLDFSWAEFGIGLPWHLIRSTEPVTVLAHGMMNICTMWVPPIGGRLGFQIEVHLQGVEQSFKSQRVIDVGERLLPNQPSPFEFPVRNPYPFTITVNMGAIRYLPQWEVVFDPPVFDLAPFAVRPVMLIVVPIQRPGDPEPREGEPVIDVEAYWNGTNQHGLLGGFRKLFFPPIPIHQPQDPRYAEREIDIFPYPPQAGEPTHLVFEARNPTTSTQQISVTFEVANFGIGLPFTPLQTRAITLPPHSTGLAEVLWVPPFAGEFCVRVRVEAPFFTEPFYSSKNVSIVRLPRPYGPPEVFPFVIGDNGIVTRPLTITLGAVNFLSDWQLELSPSVIVLEQGQLYATTILTITPPADPANLPIDGGPVADIEAYVHGNLIGGIRKVWRPPVPLGQLGEPSYAESEIVINPDPPVANQPATFAAQVRNDSDYTQTIHLQFGWADFGVGIPFSTTNVVPTQTVITLGPHGTTTVSAQWTPAYSGHFCVQIILTNEETGDRLQSQRNVDAIEIPGPQCQSFTQEFWLQNSTPETVTVTIGASAINLPPGWEWSATPTETVLAPYGGITVTLLITPPCDLIAQGLLPSLAELNASENSARKIQVEGYDQNGELIGGVELQLVAAAEQKIYLPLVLHTSSGGRTAAGRPPNESRQGLIFAPYIYWAALLLFGGVGLCLRRTRMA